MKYVNNSYFFFSLKAEKSHKMRFGTKYSEQ